MKTVAFYVEKGGASKTAGSCQLSHYIARLPKSETAVQAVMAAPTDAANDEAPGAVIPANNRVMYIDLDSQDGRGSALMKGLKTGYSAYKVFTGDLKSSDIEPRNGVTVIEGERALRTLEANPADHKKFIANFKAFIAGCKDKFDYCVIDCPPSADVRVKAALIASDFVVAPVKLAQEHVMGVGPVLGLIELIREKLNPQLVFLGLLITQFEVKKIQKDWFQILATRYAKHLIGTKIPNRAHIQEAQQMGVWVGDLPKSAAKDTAKELAEVFNMLIEKMESQNG